MVSSITDRILVNPQIVGGKPHIAGHRITVSQIATWSEIGGYSPEEIAAMYDLTLSDVHIALAYYFDNYAEIKLEEDKKDDFVSSLRKQVPSKLK